MKNLFPRIIVEEIGEELGGKKVEEPKDSKDVGIEDFKKMNIRVGKILETSQVKGSKKLIKLIVDIGEEKRQIVAGIAEHYKIKELIGKSIIVLANLKTVKLMGIKSNGMLLAASDNDNLSLLSVDREINPGSTIS